MCCCCLPSNIGSLRVIRSNKKPALAGKIFYAVRNSLSFHLLHALYGMAGSSNPARHFFTFFIRHGRPVPLEGCVWVQLFNAFIYCPVTAKIPDDFSHVAGALFTKG